MRHIEPCVGLGDCLSALVCEFGNKQIMAPPPFSFLTTPSGGQ